VTNQELFLKAFKKAKIRCHLMTHEESRMLPFEQMVYLTAIQVWSEAMLENLKQGSESAETVHADLLKHVRSLFDLRLSSYQD